MTGNLALQDWLHFMKNEYLDGFIDDGGSALKFAVPVKEDLAPLLKDQFARDARDLGYLVAEVDAGATRVHMLQEIFFRIAEQIDWRLSARQVVLGQASELGYRTDAVNPQANTPVVTALAGVSNLSESFILQDLRPLIENAVFRNSGMSRDFRAAMTHLCLAEMGAGGQSRNETPLLEWLTGANRRVGGVRRYGIYNTIVRTNARHFLESMLCWNRFVGYSGTCVLLDDSRITLRRNPRDGLRFYTRAAVMDHYELLRELIDGADRLDGLMMVVLAGEDFLDDDIRGKGFSIYQALRSRIADEVRSRTQANPLATLVRLSDGPTEE